MENLKHRCLLMLIYSDGLHLGEVINLKVEDLQPSQNRLYVRAGKGKKDRCTLLFSKVWEQWSLVLLPNLLEKGVDLRYIQDLLGHESSKTTEIYIPRSRDYKKRLGQTAQPDRRLKNLKKICLGRKSALILDDVGSSAKEPSKRT